MNSNVDAHQVEGNNVHSDHWLQENVPHSVFNEPSCDAMDHYNCYREDIKLLSEAGLNTYRFSIEWARIQLKPEEWDEKEVEYYRNVLRCCHENGITPIVTMYHFSSPAWLVIQRGWENPKVVDQFADYCKKMVRTLGDPKESLKALGQFLQD